jgi:hypothetical protein
VPHAQLDDYRVLYIFKDPVEALVGCGAPAAVTAVLGAASRAGVRRERDDFHLRRGNLRGTQMTSASDGVPGLREKISTEFL